jgi:hypothetical protein
VEKNKGTITKTLGVEAVRALLSEGVTDLIMRRDQQDVGSTKRLQQETPLVLMKNVVEQVMNELS